MKIEKTERGFALAEFTDRYGVKCSLQKSSLATEDAIWFGVTGLHVLVAEDASVMGRQDLLAPIGTPERLNGWVEYLLPEAVHINTRMHLTQEMVRELLPLLVRFAETGEIE